MKEYDVEKTGSGYRVTEREGPALGCGDGCCMWLAEILAIPFVIVLLIILPLKLLSKIPGSIGWIFQSIYDLVTYILKAIFIELPLMVVGTVFDSLPTEVRIIGIIILVLPIIIGIGIWIKHKIDEM